MRVEKFARMLPGFASLFVLGVRIEEACIIATVSASARRAGCPKCGYDHAAKFRWWVHLPYGEFRFILEYRDRSSCFTVGEGERAPSSGLKKHGNDIQFRPFTGHRLAFALCQHTAVFDRSRKTAVASSAMVAPTMLQSFQKSLCFHNVI